MRKLLVIILCLPLAANAQANGILGNWAEPTGSVIRIEPCGHDLCARLVAVSKQAPTRFDIHNPNESKRKQPLCGLLIGRGFHLSDPDHAKGGSLYDPKSGKTYHGSMERKDDKLELRGYVGIRLFGRTEVWSRAASVPSCARN